VTESQAQNMVNAAALIVAGIYFYRKLIEPAAGSSPATAAAGSTETGEGPESPELSRAVFDRFRGPRGSFEGFSEPATFTTEGEPSTVSGAAAQLLGEGKPPSTERFVVGWGFVFLTLSLGVEASPQLAGSFAALVALGSVLTNGAQVAKDIRTQLRSEQTKKPSASTGSASPTTTVAFAGQGATTSPAVMPESAPRKKKSTKPKYKVESA
jgi:hypothetical protein